jgi:hypothetical protein
MYIMPYIPRQSSIIGKADACSGGMKKAGLVARSEFPRVNAHYLKSNTVQTMPTFTLTCCGTRGKVYGTRIVHGRPVPIN